MEFGDRERGESIADAAVSVVEVDGEGNGTVTSSGASKLSAKRADAGCAAAETAGHVRSQFNSFHKYAQISSALPKSSISNSLGQPTNFWFAMN